MTDSSGREEVWGGPELTRTAEDPGRSAAPARTGPGAAGAPDDRSGPAPADRAPGALRPRS